MGKTATQQKERRKALAGRKKHINEPLDDYEIISDCKARIKMCEADLKKYGANTVVSDKISGFWDQIIQAEKRIKNSEETIEKEVEKDGQ